MNSRRVAIIDSGGANINSIVFAFQRLGCSPTFTDDWEVIQSASHVVLPGVGSAGAAMQKLRATGLAEQIPTLQQPVIGICLGMQLLFESSQEGSVACLGVIPAQVKVLPIRPGLSIPHTGWNQNRFMESADPSFFAGLPDDFYAYFVHSFAAPLGPWTVARCRHGVAFSSMVSQRNFTGIQFHPERSGPAGSQILKRFLESESSVRV